jgi:hypothetical protein
MSSSQSWSGCAETIELRSAACHFFEVDEGRSWIILQDSLTRICTLLTPRL